jgi:hypothetical protein
MMTTIMPEGDNLRKAVKWIAELRSEGTDLSDKELVEKVCLKFNLSPLEADYMVRWIKEKT